MHVLKWILIFIANLILLSFLPITPFAWLGLLIFLFGLYQIIQRSKGKAIFSKPGTIMTIGFVISFIMSLIIVEPTSEVEKSEEFAINEEVAVDKTQVYEHEIAPGSQHEEDPTADQVASKTEMHVDAPLP